MTLAPSDRDRYLAVLSIAHYVIGALVFLVGCLPLIHLTIGIGMLSGAFPEPTSHGGEPPPEALFGLVGGMFVGIASVIIAITWSLAALMIATGRFLATRRRHTLCLIVGLLESLFAPVGTALGVLTILLLVQPGVREAFAGETAGSPTA
jgi:hypothetical protein